VAVTLAVPAFNALNRAVVLPQFMPGKHWPFGAGETTASPCG
jgi:hypothetical protein